MNALKTLAGKLSFAHLAGLSAKGSKSRADEDPDKDPEETADDDDKNYKDDQDRSNGDSKKGTRADDEQPEDRDPDAEDDEPQDGDDDGEPKNKKGKRAKAEGDDDNDPEAEDDEDEMRGKSAAASARRRERARCAAIMGSRYAAGNVVLAANLAFNTTMTRKQALAVLRDTPPAATEPLHTGRASRNPRLGAGGEAAPTSQQAIESRWERTMKRVTGR